MPRPRLDAAAPGAGNAAAMSEARAEDRALRLRRALRRQTELNRLQREFMLMAAHEFGTPLAIIDSQAQGLARRAERIAPDDLRRRLEKIRAAVARMNEMVQRSLAAFSSSLTDADEPGPLAGPGDDADLLGEVGESRRVEIDMPRLVGDTCRAYQELSSAHQIVQDLDGLPRSVWGDHEQVRQILVNLLANAIKYSPRGGRIEVTGRTAGAAAVISIRDEGLGIAAQDRDKIFRPFYRAANTTGIAGTGLGLSLVQKVIEQHGGAIAVASEEGEGSTFTVSLPIDLRGSQRAAAQAAAAHAAAPPAGG